MMLVSRYTGSSYRWQGLNLDGTSPGTAP